MRIDMLMNKLCLVKTRSIAKKAFDKKLILLNDKVAKAASLVAAGDILVYTLYGWKNTLEITQVPDGNVSKKNAPEFYKILEREKLDIED